MPAQATLRRFGLTYRSIDCMFGRMRITVRLDDHLLSQARRCAAAAGKTLTALLEEALREKLGRRAGRPRRRPVRLRTCDGTGALPGVDLDDSASLLDRMATRGVRNRLG
jgi:Arc/MetJ family transcription regulator